MRLWRPSVAPSLRRLRAMAASLRSRCGLVAARSLRLRFLLLFLRPLLRFVAAFLRPRCELLRSLRFRLFDAAVAPDAAAAGWAGKKTFLTEILTSIRPVLTWDSVTCFAVGPMFRCQFGSVVAPHCGLLRLVAPYFSCCSLFLLVAGDERRG